MSLEIIRCPYCEQSEQQGSRSGSYCEQSEQQGYQLFLNEQSEFRNN